jgi:hypothetical protein
MILTLKVYGKLPYNATVRQRLARPRARKRTAFRRPSLSKARLNALVEEATTDAYNEGEQIVGFLTLIDDHLATPFETNVLGANVTVERMDLTEGDEIAAICRRAGKTLKVPILDLPLPFPPPRGAEWIAAYRYWRTGRR